MQKMSNGGFESAFSQIEGELQKSDQIKITKQKLHKQELTNEKNCSRIRKRETEENFDLQVLLKKEYLFVSNWFW